MNQIDEIIKNKNEISEQLNDLGFDISATEELLNIIHKKFVAAKIGLLSATMTGEYNHEFVLVLAPNNSEAYNGVIQCRYCGKHILENIPALCDKHPMIMLDKVNHIVKNGSE